MAYCEVADLLIGDIPTSAQLDPQKYVNDAADEIDSKIGFVYDTPIDVTPTGPTTRPAALLLKRLNSHLASGRLIMAATILVEDKNLNAYGQYLVNDSMLTLDAIGVKRSIVLSGAALAPGVTSTGDNQVVTAPMINNLDSASQVEGFYNKIAMPGSPWIAPDYWARPGGFVADYNNVP